MTEERHETTPGRSRPQHTRLDLGRPQVRGGAVIALAILVGFVVWLVVRGGGSDEGANSPAPAAAKPVLVSASGLRTIANSLTRPIYWAGAKRDLQYELTRTTDGRVWIRYLPADENVGEQETPYLTIGTYPVANAYAVTSAAARRGGVRLKTRGGAVAFYSNDRPTNVYVAYPKSNYQIEVFDPSADTAQELVKRGEITTIAGKRTPAATAPTAVTRAGLDRIAARAKGPVYWVGPARGVKYEVTQSPDGRIYVRYLPPGVAAGSTRQYLTIGTYPVKNAVAATKTAASSGNAETIDVGSGGFAFYDNSSPTNVHLAYPGSDYQIEVFDPSPERAHRLVSSGRLTTVR